MSHQLCERQLCTSRAVAYIENEFLCADHAPVDAEVHW